MIGSRGCEVGWVLIHVEHNVHCGRPRITSIKGHGSLTFGILALKNHIRCYKFRCIDQYL